MKKSNSKMKEKISVIVKWFNSLPNWAKPIVIITLIVIKVVVPTAILVVAVYKYAAHKTEKKYEEEKTAEEDVSDEPPVNINDVRSAMFTPHYSWQDDYARLAAEEGAVVIAESAAKALKTKEE